MITPSKILAPAVGSLLLLVAVPRAEAGRQETPDQMERRAEELYAADRLEEAADLYLRLGDRLEDPSEQARALVLAAWLQTLRGRPDLASRTLDGALARDPDYEIDPQSFSERFHQTFEQLREARGGGATALPSSESINEGLQLLRSGDLLGARSIFDQAATADPSDEQVQFLLARIESRLGEADSAMNRLRALSARIARGERLSVASAEIDAELGIMAYRTGDAQAAADAFARAVAAAPEDVVSWQNLGLARTRLDDLAGAAVAFRRALDLDPSQPEVTRLLANTLLRLHREPEALPLLRGLTAGGSQDARIWLDLALAERRTGELAAASQAFARAAELDPHNELEVGALALAQQAIVELESDRPEAAAETARRALAIDRGNVDALNVLGLALLETGDPGEAATQLERARALEPSRSDLANNLGKALFAARRLEEAVEAFEAALELDPSLQTARQNLEVARRSLADPTGASTTSTASRTTGTRPPAETRSTPRTASQPTARAQPSGDRLPLGARLADVRHAGTGRNAVEVLSVDPGGVAERSGLRVGDLILRVGSQGIGAFGIENAAAVSRRLEGLASGESVRVDLFRGQEALAVTVRRD